MSMEPLSMSAPGRCESTGPVASSGCRSGRSRTRGIIFCRSGLHRRGRAPGRELSNARGRAARGHDAGAIGLIESEAHHAHVVDRNAARYCRHGFCLQRSEWSRVQPRPRPARRPLLPRMPSMLRRSTAHIRSIRARRLLGSSQTVVWRNRDTVTHHVVFDDNAIDTGTLAPGTLSQPMTIGAGTWNYHCSIHPTMVGTRDRESS